MPFGEKSDDLGSDDVVNDSYKIGGTIFASLTVRQQMHICSANNWFGYLVKG